MKQLSFKSSKCMCHCNIILNNNILYSVYVVCIMHGQWRHFHRFRMVIGQLVFWNVGLLISSIYELCVLCPIYYFSCMSETLLQLKEEVDEFTISQGISDQETNGSSKYCTKQEPWIREDRVPQCPVQTLNPCVSSIEKTRGGRPHQRIQIVSFLCLLSPGKTAWKYSLGYYWGSWLYSLCF